MMASAPAVEFTVGECFSSYSQLQEKLDAYQKTNFVQLTHRDSRTLDKARKRAPKRVEQANSALVYYSLDFACVFGGKKYKNGGTGQRSRQCTVKQGCPAGHKFRLSEDGKSLVVASISEDHNHEVDADIYKHLPHQRRLGTQEKEEVEKLLKLKVNKKLLQQHVSSSCDKVVTLKDISNVQTGLHKKTDRNDLDALVAKLKAIDGSTVEIFTADDDVFTGLLFQDFVMKFSFASYPEVLIVDATYKLNELRMPLYLMLVVDSNGQSEIVAVFLTSLETEEAISRMVQAFKSHNPKWSETVVVISDKDFTERAVFQKEFPDSSLLICLFHSLRSMRREVTCDKLGLLPGERDHALEILTQLAYSSSAEKYDDHYTELKMSGLKSVIKYYDTNWHPIRQQWVECFKGANFTVGERTNNRLESINAKVKSVCSKYANLSTFFDQFFSVLSCLRNERDHSTLMAMAKKRVSSFSPDSPEEKYSLLLTPYAVSFVLKQLELRSKVKIDEDNGETCIISSSNGMINVTVDECQCMFRKSMNLPCRHIFAVRDIKSTSLYDSDLVSKRWTISYMRETFKNKKGFSSENSTVQITSIPSEGEKSVLSQHQKFRKTSLLAQELASLASEVGMSEFKSRFGLLKRLRDVWAEGKKAVVTVIDEETLDEAMETDALDTDVVQDTPELIEAEVVQDDALETEVIQDIPGLIEAEVVEDHTTSQDDLNNLVDDHYPEKGDCPRGYPCQSLSDQSASIKKLKLPPVIKKRGRPKGAEKTCIGLPSRKKAKRDQPVPFLKKCPASRDEVILSWFVDQQIKEAVLARKRLVQEEDVEMRPERISASCLDENVCVSSVQKYFSDDAWAALTQVLEVVKKNAVWYCGGCSKAIINDSTEDSIVCD